MKIGKDDKSGCSSILVPLSNKNPTKHLRVSNRYIYVNTHILIIFGKGRLNLKTQEWYEECRLLLFTLIIEEIHSSERSGPI
jgi:hypothetical protein